MGSYGSRISQIVLLWNPLDLGPCIQAMSRDPRDPVRLFCRLILWILDPVFFCHSTCLLAARLAARPSTPGVCPAVPLPCSRRVVGGGAGLVTWLTCDDQWSATERVDSGGEAVLPVAESSRHQPTEQHGQPLDQGSVQWWHLQVGRAVALHPAALVAGGQLQPPHGAHVPAA